MGVLVIAEHDNTSLSPATLNTVTAATALGEVTMLVASANCRPAAEAAAAVDGVARVLLADDPSLEHGLAENLAPLIQGLGGLMSITGLPGQGPVRAGIPIADLTAGLYAALGTLMALLEREETGHGQWVQSSLLSSQIAMLDFQAARWLMKGEVAPQAGNNHPTSIPTGVFKTADGHINIAAAGDIIWERLCKVLDVPDMAENPDFASGADRSENRDAVNAGIEKRTVGKTSAEWIDLLNEAGITSENI